MAQRSWSVQDAKNRFSEVVEAARRVPQTVTKHGKPAVVVVDVVEYGACGTSNVPRHRPLPMRCLPCHRTMATFRAATCACATSISDVPDRYRYAIRAAQAQARSDGLSNGLNDSGQPISSSASLALAQLSAELRDSARPTHALRALLQNGWTES
ncbi:type II toxin-antitoxin system prevent-host-death family antitoxin [Bradyrhizobium sp. AUGA SZCCT0160]|uniref:type II toxin-antitoxin system prevent-host-death family antitoxin n=1 Tax=Bradyrhizobium sp. AUGA SZCCT0160 TaxID=2807662 RepID=UPI00201130E1|nr:type II toxin-antitoxin system prevent-host-death family antitoxin [Bradyrhizobium sp. AUGA SZCCT0160]